jgi:TfoX/Sxy family transcriptional regulator of competence genes
MDPNAGTILADGSRRSGTVRPMTSEQAWLKEQIQSALGPRRGLTWRRMFGCDAAFRDGLIFALVWTRDGRIAVKLTDGATFAELAAVPGVDPWAPGGKGLRGWLMMPPAWSENEDRIGPWLERAFAGALAHAAPPKRAAKKTSAARATPPAREPAKKRPAKRAATKKAPASKPAKKAATEKAPASKPAKR